MKLIVGLGNPGKEYEETRHNAGFNFIDSYAKANNLEINQMKFNGQYSTLKKDGETIILLKPQKYINLSGEVIKEFVDYFKIKIDDILIIHDDIDTNLGKTKFKRKGSSGGHNGLKDIERHLHTQEYKRLKIGVSNNSNQDIIKYVIGKMPKSDKEKLNQINKLAPQMLDDYLKLDFESLMSKYN